MSISSQAWTASAAGLTVRASWKLATTVSTLTLSNTSLVCLTLYFVFLYLYFDSMHCLQYHLTPLLCLETGLEDMDCLTPIPEVLMAYLRLDGKEEKL